MSEREKLPSWSMLQQTDMSLREPDSLVARGLSALQERKRNELVLNSQDGRYRQARNVFDRQVCNIRKKGWTEEEREALFSAFKSLGRMAAEKYGKAYFPLAWFYNSGWRILPSGQGAADDAGFSLLNDPGQTEHYEQLAFEWCARNRHADDPELWFDLAACYLRGIAVEPDVEQSLHWLKKSAERGHELAQNQLGRMYETGRGSERDDAQAAYWYGRAAEQGNAWALAELGAMHLKGRGVEQDYERAVDRFRKAAERGNVAAQCFLAWLYRDGRGVAQSCEKSAFWFRKAAEQGDELAQYFLGGLCEEHPELGLGEGQAVFWYRKAAEQGHAGSQKQLGKMYRDGRGTARDDAQAAYWFRKSALQGNDWGQYYLGMMHLAGLGVTRDEDLALYWLHKAAEQGLELAREQVAQLRGGVQARADEAAVPEVQQAELFVAPQTRVRRFPVSGRVRANAGMRGAAEAKSRHTRSGRRGTQFRRSASGQMRRTRSGRRGGV
ncbi:MAG TPA: tetratricopeptide repeat protein [Gallionella sp.]|nr:tetratricopeptide repeat protein [Gallionella sp.]